MSTCRNRTSGRFASCRARRPGGARASAASYRASAGGYDEGELVLFGDNDYPTYQMLQAIRANLRKHKARGRLDSAKAVVAFQHAADFADKRYSREVYRDRRAGFNFTPAHRRAAAKEWAARFSRTDE